MKISESSLALQATSFRASRIEVAENLSAWGGQGATVERGGRALPEVRVSDAAREALQADESAAAGASGRPRGEAPSQGAPPWRPYFTRAAAMVPQLRALGSGRKTRRLEVLFLFTPKAT